jgi:TPP-dependent pyruvate/acetoin dehydrogenase alpha subunit
VTSAPGTPSLIAFYETIRRIRDFENTLISLFQDGAVPGFTHNCIGQEASAAGVVMALRPDDRLYSNHRGHGHIIAKGADTSGMMAEALGRSSGLVGGYGGEMHIMDPSVGVWGTNAIVAAGLPIATGSALADRLAGRDTVTVVFFGDGATSEGTFAESLNIAANWRLPVVFVCENNQYGEFTPASEAVAGEIVDRATGYGIPGVRVDGQDVEAVHAASSEAVARARSGDGPTLIESATYRWWGHFYGEEALIGAQSYRSQAEIDDWKANRDPLKNIRSRCLSAGVPEEDLDAIDAAVAEEMDAAVAFAKAAPLPDPAAALDHVFVAPVAALPT